MLLPNLLNRPEIRNPGHWTSEMVTPDSQAANITLRMNVDFAGDMTNPGGDVPLGDIRFAVTPVPEPGAGLLVVLAAAGWLGRRRR